METEIYILDPTQEKQTCYGVSVDHKGGITITQKYFRAIVQ